MSTAARLLALLVVLVVLGPKPIAANVPTFSHRPVAIFEYDAGRVSACRYDDRPEDLKKSMCPVASRPSSTTGAWCGEASSLFRHHFTGKERDAETGLDYFGARYMSAAQGRFTSPDSPFADQFTSNPQSWNLYSYTRNNPLKYVDPDGQSVRICITGGTCFEVPDSDYPGLQPGNPGTVLPTFNFGRDEISIQPITCGGQFCGTATYINDNPGITPIYFPIGELREQLAPFNPRNWMRTASRTTIKSSMKEAKDDLEKKKPLNLSQKLQDQMKQRGWTEQEIREALGAPGIPAQGKKGPATRHVHPTTGKSVVVDNATGEIFHVGGEGYKYD